MGEYIQLISQDKKNIYLPKKVAELSEYMRKEIESNALYSYIYIYLHTRFQYLNVYRSG